MCRALPRSVAFSLSPSRLYSSPSVRVSSEVELPESRPELEGDRGVNSGRELKFEKTDSPESLNSSLSCSPCPQSSSQPWSGSGSAVPSVRSMTPRSVPATDSTCPHPSSLFSVGFLCERVVYVNAISDSINIYA